MRKIILQSIRKLVNGIVGDDVSSETPLETKCRYVAFRIQQILIEEGINEN